MEYEQLNQKYSGAVDALMSALKEAVKQALQANITIKGDDPGPLSGEFTLGHEFPLVRVALGSTTDSAYEHQFLLDKSIAGLIFSWMVGEEPPEEVGAEHLDAVKEMVGQVLGQLQAALDGEEHAFTAGKIEVTEVATQDDLGLPEEGLVASYRFTRGKAKQKYLVTHVVKGDLMPAAEGETPDEEPSGEKDVGEEAPSEEVSGEDVAADLAGDDAGVTADVDMDDLFGDGGDSEAVIEASAAEFEEFEDAGPSNGEGHKIDMLLDVELDVTVELGRKIMHVEEILKLGKGSVIELDKLAGEPVDILINGKKLAEGEVVVIEDHFGVRLTYLLEARDRIKSLGR